MGFRFQRRIKIAPGISLNVSKKGLGASIGPRGGKISVGPRGVHGHAGIPGTGLAYRRKINTSQGKGRGGAHGSVSTGKALEEYLLSGGTLATQVEVQEDGSFQVLEGGVPFDESEVRVIKKLAGDSLRGSLQQHCEHLNADLEALGSVHLETLPPRDTPIFEPRDFFEERPVREAETPYSFWARIWPPAKSKIDDLNQRKSYQFIGDIEAWEERKREFELREEARKIRETIAIYNDTDSMAVVLEESLRSIPWPRETQINFDFGNDASTIAIDVQLPPEESFPDTEYSVAEKQVKVTTRKVTATRRRQLYRDYAHGVALRVVGEVYHRLPSVSLVLISAFAPRLDEATGHIDDVYLYSAMVNKAEWKKINFDALDQVEPVAALERFELRRSMTKTGVFKPVEPFGDSDVLRLISD